MIFGYNMKYFIYPYKYDCDNAITLENLLGGKRIKLENSSYEQKPDHVIINWGNSKCPYTENVVNHPRNVGWAVNKLLCFDILRNNNIQTVPITRNLS